MEAKINRLEVQITSLNAKTDKIEPLVEGALGGLSKLKKLYIEGDTVRKRKIIGSIYPEKLMFDGFHWIKQKSWGIKNIKHRYLSV